MDWNYNILYTIVDAVSSNLKEGTIVLHRNMKIHPTYKAYKRFCYDLYRVKDGINTLIFSHEETKNSNSKDLNEVWAECDKEYLNKFIEWLMKDGVQ